MSDQTNPSIQKHSQQNKELSLIKDWISILNQKLDSTDSEIVQLKKYDSTKSNQLDHLSDTMLKLCDLIEKISTKVTELENKISKLETNKTDEQATSHETESDYTTDMNKIRIKDIKHYLRRLEEKYHNK